MQSSHDPLPDDLIDTTVAAKIARCHVTSLHRWIFKGKLRAWRRMGRYMVSQSDVEQLFAPVVPSQPSPPDFSEKRNLSRTPKQREREILSAERRLNERGI